MTHRYVCAFRGRRDSYQVPLALAESDQLDLFITDGYAFSWVRSLAQLAPARLREKVCSRRESAIPESRVKCLWGTTVLEHLRHRLGYAPVTTYGHLDRNYSKVAGQRAAENRSDLFLYSPYAWDAFTRPYQHTPRKVMFQYHPHPALETRLLSVDRGKHPDMGESFSGATIGGSEIFHEADAWQHADLIFCASSFTRRSLLEAGAEEARCRVVPYGIDLGPAPSSQMKRSEDFKVLFAGSGGQRKGLHHLLLAWRRASLPANSRLTLVCRVLDEGIARLVARTPHVTLLPGVSQETLQDLYCSSSLMALPSLVEGFGQVYLEALANGCPVLGTPNTGLPDLGDERDGIFLVSPGDVDELTAQLERLAHFLPASPTLRASARACAGRFSWESFRTKIRADLTAAIP